MQLTWKKKKLNCCGCAGIFNSPVAIEIVTQIFEENDSLENLEKFISTNGADFYNLPLNEEYIEIKKEEWKVPEKFGNVVPLYAGKTIIWKQI